MAKKKITQHLYFKEDIKLVNHELRYVELDNGWLFSSTPTCNRKTKITKDDLPESFIHGRYYKRWGYLDTAHIKKFEYFAFSYFLYDYFSLRDDKIIITYDDDKTVSVWGNNIIDVLKGAKKYSNYDIEPIKKDIWKHIEEFNKNPRDKNIEIVTKKEFEGWWKQDE